MTHLDEVEHLLRRSREFLETAHYQTGNRFYDLAAFSLEQSLQLFLKAKLIQNGVEYPRHHGVRTLIEILIKVLPDETKTVLKEILDKYLLEFGMLEDAYISSRYITREFRKEEVERLREAVEAVIGNVG
jgi:HEPN domain-containing protein